MIQKKISLFLSSVLIIVLIYCIPFYNNWFNTKFDHEADRIIDQIAHQTPEDRMMSRFGTTYIMQHAISNMLSSVKAKNVMVLLPPNEYVKAFRTEEGTFEVPEPAVFYYFTGYKAVMKSSPEVRLANWALVVENHKMAMRHINSPAYLDSLLIQYKQYN